MSIFERSVQICRFQRSAADYYQLAALSLSTDVRKRYHAIADHYAALSKVNSARIVSREKSDVAQADVEGARRVAEMVQAIQDRTPVPQPGKLHVIHGEGHGTGHGQRRIRLPARSNRNRRSIV